MNFLALQVTEIFDLTASPKRAIFTDRKRSDELLSRLGIECVEDKIRRARSRWFGHVERKEENDWVKKCTRMNVTGVVGRGAPRRTWKSCVERDI